MAIKRYVLRKMLDERGFSILFIHLFFFFFFFVLCIVSVTNYLEVLRKYSSEWADIVKAPASKFAITGRHYMKSSVPFIRNRRERF